MQDGRLQKRPATAHSHHDASLDPDVVRDMFVQAQMRHGGVLAVGLLPGAGNLIVLDPDVKTDDRDGVRFADSLGIPFGWLVFTPSGGQHRYFCKPDPLARYSNKVPPAWNGFIDIRVDHGWVVAPGTVTPWGSWRAEAPWPDQGPPRAPQAVLEALTYGAGQSGATGTPGGRLTPDREALLPEHTLAVLHWLETNHGAHNPLLMMRAGDVNYVAVTRPGKRVGISATIGFADTGALHLYSSSWVIEGVEQAVTCYPLGRDTDTLGARAAVAAATPVPAGPFFVRGSFQVQTMAAAVMSDIPLALDRTDGGLWYYRDGVWRPMLAGDDVVLAGVTGRLGERFRTSHYNNVREYIRGQAPTIRPSDPNPRYVNTPGGMLEWRTGELCGHAPEFQSVNQITARWEPGARCPAFDAWIAEVLPGDLVGQWLDELLGYLVLSGNPFQKAILLLGRGRNGKGTFIRVVQALLGDENYSNVTLQGLVGNRFGAADMYGKLANICGDLDSSRLESTAMFKMVTGGDTISAERKFGHAFSFTPYAVPFFSANAVFGTPDTSDGYMSRWVIVPFPNSFEGGADRALTERLTTEAELAGILARAIRGLRTLMLRNDFQMADSVRAAREQFERESDPIRAFIADCTGPGGYATRHDLWTTYTVWAAESGHAALARTKFYARLEETGLAPTALQGVRAFKGRHMTQEAHYGSLVPKVQ